MRLFKQSIKRGQNVLCCCFRKKRRRKSSGQLGILNSGTGVTTQRPGLAQMVHLMDSRKPLDLNPHTDHWAASLTMPCHRGLSHEQVIFLMEEIHWFLPTFHPIYWAKQSEKLFLSLWFHPVRREIKGSVLEKKVRKQRNCWVPFHLILLST